MASVAAIKGILISNLLHTLLLQLNVSQCNRVALYVDTGSLSNIDTAIIQHFVCVVVLRRFNKKVNHGSILLIGK